MRVDDNYYERYTIMLRWLLFSVVLLSGSISPYTLSVHSSSTVEPHISSSNKLEEKNEENSKAELIVSHSSIKPGEPFWAVIKISMKPGWHTYWQNPGDTGLAPQVKWDLPKDFIVSPLQYSSPTRFTYQGIVSFGYENNAYFVAKITPPTIVTESSVSLKAKVNWLLCKDSCIPQEAVLSLGIPINQGTAQKGDESETIDKILTEIPVLLETKGAFALNDQTVVLTIPKASFQTNVSDQKSSIDSVLFFPMANNVIDNNAPQKFEERGESLLITLQRLAKKNDKTPQNLSGVLQVKKVGLENPLIVSVDFDQTQVTGEVGKIHSSLPLSDNYVAKQNFWMVILFALLGGIILNIMPCVFPVLALKALSVVQESTHHYHRYARQGGYYFTFGVVLSFLLLASLLLLLRAGGSYIGWGFQMQNSYFVGLMVVVLYFLGLSLSGEIYLPALFGESQVKLSQSTQNHKWSNFWVGVLAVLVATPCTAPFMGVAIGYALTQSPNGVLIIFFFLGLGFALPYLLLSLFPLLVRIFPKPGAWMETFKELMAFPIYLSVAWFLWILAKQEGPGGLIIALTMIIIVKFFVWLWKRIRDNSIFEKKAYRYFVILILVGGSVSPLMLLEHRNKEIDLEVRQEKAYSPQALDELRKQKKPVLVYATAAWCITCKVNELTLRSESSELLYKKLGITLLKADWTNKSEEITQFLAKYGYSGVPLYVYYPAGKEGIILPQILTQSMISDTLINDAK